jgi:hypothetical protein
MCGKTARRCAPPEQANSDTTLEFTKREGFDDWNTRLGPHSHQQTKGVRS